MVRQACIAIGVNRYQFLQPLSFATADAQSVQEFCAQGAGWPADQCLLMTDSSPTHQGRDTTPSRGNIQSLLNHWCWDLLQPGDFLYFFFSGYGAKTPSGEYLLPLDADPQHPEQTGLSLSQLYRQITAPGLSALLVLDVNRSGGATSQGFGCQTRELAQEFAIPTFLSCQPEEFSQEAAGLHHGIFTAALLEALRFNPDFSYKQLQEYLASRVPELSSHHWRPLQHPLAALPNSPLMLQPIFGRPEGRGFFVPSSSFHSPTATTSPEANTGAIVPYQTPQRQKSAPRPAAATAPRTTKAAPVFSRSLVVGLAGTAVALGVVLAVMSSPKTTPVVTPTATNRAATIDSRDPWAAAQAVVQSGDAEAYARGIALAQQVPESHPQYDLAREATEKWAQRIYVMAQEEAAAQQWAKAIEIAQLVPPESSLGQAAQNSRRLWQQKLTSP